VETNPGPTAQNNLIDLDGGKVALVLDQELLAQPRIGAVKQTKPAAALKQDVVDFSAHLRSAEPPSASRPNDQTSGQLY
jgi:hypothetical protein